MSSGGLFTKSNALQDSILKGFVLEAQAASSTGLYCEGKIYNMAWCVLGLGIWPLLLVRSITV